jgi:hypothetical protein
MVAAPVVALLQLAQLDGAPASPPPTSASTSSHARDRLALAFAWVFAIAAGIAGTYG